MSTTVGVQLLQEYPELLVAVTVLVRAALAWQTQLTWHEYRTLHRLKRGVFPVVNRYAGTAILWVSNKGGRDDPEYIDTLDKPYREVVTDLRRGGGTLHLLNSLKRRPDTHGDSLSVAHLVWTHADGKQTECYLFRNSDGTTDLYCHVETSVSDPLGHLTDRQKDGDARNVLGGVSFV